MKYPIYIPSRGRADNCITAKMLTNQGVPFTLVVEADEYEQYAAIYERDRVIASTGGSEIQARNLAKRHSTELGFDWHWQLDDDIYSIIEVENRKILGKSVDKALSYVEDYTDRYNNVAIAGLALSAFGKLSTVSVRYNKQVCNCFMVRNDTPYLWRDNVVSDTDYSLQVLYDGWVTITFFNFLASIAATEKLKGGNTDYYKNGGKLLSVEGMIKAWPDITRIVYSKNGRPKAYTGHLWGRKFKQQPILKEINES